MKWDQISLGDIALRKGGSVDPKKHPDEVFELYSIPAFDAGAPEVVAGSAIGSSKKAVEPNDVMISRIVPHIRRACVVGPANGHRKIASGEWIIFRDESIWQQYLRWVLIGDVFHSAFMRTVSGVGGSLLRARPAEVFKIQIPVPPLAEQKRIARILDAVDALRAKRRASLAQLDALVQSTFHDMFGDPVANPMGWEARPLRDIAKVKSGNGLVAKHMALDGEIPVYGGNGINGYHDAYMFEEPMIILGRVGVYCGAVHLTKPRAWVTDNALYFRDFLLPVDRTYFVEALKIANLNQYANQAAQPLISGSRIYPVPILLPPIDYQRRFATLVESIERQKARKRAHLAELNALFASLQHRAFSGEL